MALAHLPAAPALGQQRFDLSKAGLGPAAEGVQRFGVSSLREVFAQRDDVVAGERDHLGRRAPWAVVRRHACMGLERGEVLREGLQLLGAQSAARAQVIEPTRLVKTAHLHREFNRFAVVIAGRSPTRVFGTAQQRQHAQVQLGGGIAAGKTAVDAQLGFAGGMAPCQRTEVHEGEAHWLLDFVSPVAREQHPGAVGFDQLHRRHRVRVAAGGQQGLDQGRQCVRHAPHCT